MPLMSYALYVLLGRRFGGGDLVAVFSARLDETGTDELSQYILVGGAVAAPTQWDDLEKKWGGLLRRYKIPAFHGKEFRQRIQQFAGWSDLKCRRFTRAQEKIINNNTLFRVSIGLDRAVHADIKKRMKGVSGFSADSDYSLCLRYLMFAVCERLVKVDHDARLTVLVEDGPWACGAAETYQRVAAMTGKWKSAKHAHRLAGFASAPKGERHSLEAADYLAGAEYERIIAGGPQHRKANTLSLLLTKPLLEKWYQGVRRRIAALIMRGNLRGLLPRWHNLPEHSLKQLARLINLK